VDIKTQATTNSDGYCLSKPFMILKKSSIKFDEIKEDDINNSTLASQTSLCFKNGEATLTSRSFLKESSRLNDSNKNSPSPNRQKDSICFGKNITRN
jgi:hypothetical protein